MHFLALFILAMASAGQALLADSETNVFRLTVGVKVFQAFLAADQGLNRRTLPGGELTVLVVREEPAGMDAVAALNALEPIKEMPIRARTVTVAGLAAWSGAAPCCLFVGAPLLDELDHVLAFARERKIPVFSPFAGDVARGATAGILVTDRIVPLVNPRALEENSVSLKPFFLKAAARDE